VGYPRGLHVSFSRVRWHSLKAKLVLCLSRAARDTRATCPWRGMITSMGLLVYMTHGGVQAPAATHLSSA
jgi:hypothetical protein